VRETYRWSEDTYDQLHAAGIAWQAAMYVLHDAHPHVRRHLGAVLYVSAPDRDGRWLMVVLIEEADDAYLVVGARYLDADEVEAAVRIIRGGQ
jgi:hypothetical protein